MSKKSWFRNIFLGIGGMIFGALFMVTGLLIFTVEILFQGLEKILICLGG